MNTDASNQVRGFEKCVWMLDESPLDMVHRAGIGLLMLPAHDVLFGRESSLWRFIVFFFVTLLVLKFGLGVVRRFFPASAELKAAWRERRMLGKAYDSYQWRKLTGYGVGLMLYLVLMGRGHDVVLLYFASGCIAAGTGGRVIWSKRQSTLAAVPASAT